MNCLVQTWTAWYRHKIPGIDMNCLVWRWTTKYRHELPRIDMNRFKEPWIQFLSISRLLHHNILGFCWDLKSFKGSNLQDLRVPALLQCIFRPTYNQTWTRHRPATFFYPLASMQQSWTILSIFKTNMNSLKITGYVWTVITPTK